jgi:hypothetical protein
MRKLAMVLFVLLFLSGLVGCTELKPRVETLATKAMQEIDAAIGKEDVQRQKVLDAVQNAQREVERLQRVEAESSVDAEMLSAKLDDLNRNKELATKGLLQLADLIDAGKPVTLTNGAVMSVTELVTYADRKKAEFETLNKKMAIYEESIAVSTKTAQDAHDRWVEGKRVVDTLKAQVDLLDTRIAALRAARPSSSAAVVNSTYEDVVAQAQTTMDEVSGSLENELKVIEKLREVQKVDGPNEKQLELDLRSSGDLASELRDLANK